MKCLSLHMNGKDRGLVVHRLKSDELAPCHLGTGKDARVRFSAPTFRVNYAPKLPTLARHCFPKALLPSGTLA